MTNRSYEGPSLDCTEQWITERPIRGDGGTVSEPESSNSERAVDGEDPLDSNGSSEDSEQAVESEGGLQDNVPSEPVSSSDDGGRERERDDLLLEAGSSLIEAGNLLVRAGLGGGDD